MIHGALKGVGDCAGSHFVTGLTHNQSNVLMDTTGHARITDFGLAMVAQNPDSVQNASAEYVHNVRWTAPEILDGKGTYSMGADVFSFAMVTIEVGTR